MNELERVRELLPWHVRGALEDDERVFMDRWLAENLAQQPDLAAELAWLKTTSTQLQDLARPEPALAEAGLKALMQRIELDKEAQGAQSRSTTNVHQTPLADRITGWVTALLGVRLPALALTLTLVLIVQIGVIGALIFTEPASQAPLGNALAPISALPGQVLLTVAFKPTASESAMRGVLANAQLQIVAGPSALGLYTLAAARERADSAILQLRQASAVVESVQR